MESAFDRDCRCFPRFCCNHGQNGHGWSDDRMALDASKLRRPIQAQPIADLLDRDPHDSPNIPLMEMEQDQEQKEKRGRGRPRVLPAETVQQLRGVYRDIQTDRQIQARTYALEALKAMDRMPKPAGEFPPPTWLVDWAGGDRGKQGAMKWGVLEELGRMVVAGMDIASLVWVLENQSEHLDRLQTAKSAQARLRAIRLGR